MDTTNSQSSDPQSQVPEAPQQPSVPQPMSGGHKEQAPMSVRSEYVTPAPVETSPQISQELRDVGIEESPDTHKPDIPPDVQQTGLKPVKTAVPVTPQSQVQDQPVEESSPTPVPYQQAMTNLKTHKADESISWLSMLSKYISEKLGLQKTA